MISAKTFLNAAQERGFKFFIGVPCSFLTPLINQVISNPQIDYLGATNEGEAVAIAAGAWLAGKQSVVMCQNSGLGNMVSPLTSLNFPFRIPTLIICTWRGQPGLADEPQHELMGKVTEELLSSIRIGFCKFPTAATAIEEALDRALAAQHETGLPFALLMEKGAVEAERLEQPEPKKSERGVYEDCRRDGPTPTRFAALERFLNLVPEDAAVISTTGKCSRELFQLSDREQHFYQVGSMGCASAIGLGVALYTSRRVIVLDGDGAALMRLGNLATIGANAPGSFIHIIFDNGAHDSTGGQRTVSYNLDFTLLSIACGYRSAFACDTLEAFDAAFRMALAQSGPHLIHLRILAGSLSGLGRPSLKPHEVARRFRGFLASDLGAGV
jgi:phosphonopyruvate decarboxylase